MAKLKNIIKQLSADDFKTIYDQLISSNAEKSAHLLKFMRERQMSDTKIMETLDVGSNAYYTLRSRLNQKIEEYLLSQMEQPRTDLMKRVANINDTVFTKKLGITLATLKKLEKELLDYDLSNELTIIYKILKRLHIHTKDSFHYNQQYNRHVAYMLAIDKAEDLLADYFKKYGNYFLNGTEIEKFELSLLYNELSNVCNLYQSHRLYVIHNCVGIFHRLFVDQKVDIEAEEAIEDVFERIEETFDTYFADTTYFHMRLVFEFLKLEYYSNIRVFRKADKFYEEVNGKAALLLSNYRLFTFSGRFLLNKLERALRNDAMPELYEENKEIFVDFEADKDDRPTYILYYCYRALCCYYVDKYDEACKWLNTLLNEPRIKEFNQAHIEIKLLLTLQYCLQKDYDLFNQSVNSIQRQVRLLGDQQQMHVTNFIKLLKISLGENKASKAARLRDALTKVLGNRVQHFSPVMLIKMDDKFIEKLM